MFLNGVSMSYLDIRKSETQKKFSSLKNEVAPLNNLLEGKACIYATGSFGRLDAGTQSDLDLFIVSKVATTPEKQVVNLLSNLDVILTKAKLIEAVRKLGLPDFDSDGKYLECHSIYDFTSKMGGRQDDYSNALTGRLLMFLEGRPLIQDDVFNEIIEEVAATYFKDFADHPLNFLPAYLMNDILRLWRTFCVNYEFSRKGTSSAKAKVKNFKLKHSRMLTCYSAICFMSWTFRNNETVSPKDIVEMTKLSPLERLSRIEKSEARESVSALYNSLLENYEGFLRLTDLPKEELEERITSEWPTIAQDSYKFGDDFHALIREAGGESRLMRLLMI